jgi:Mlc titration factor MtfA (ptsG expression regulator)
MIFAALRWWNRQRLRGRSLPQAWYAIAKERFAYLDELGGNERARFFEHLKVFAWRVHWEGAGGLEVTDEMRVIVSGAAARLARNLPLHVYDHLTTVILYPSHYQHEDKDGIIFGEANRWGVVVLSWDAVQGGIANPGDGHDTALHELAHVLDVADGAFDGTPILEDGDYRGWAAALSKSYLELKRHPGRRRALLRDYGATNEAEFFAVATEAFFEKPEQMKKKAPDLYAELKDYYRVDPAR